MLGHVAGVRPGNGSAVAKLSAFWLVAAFASIFASIAAAHTSPRYADASCRAYALKRPAGVDLRVVCDGRNGLRIGEFDSYEAATNTATGALAIRTSSSGRLHVFLVFPDAVRRPFVQDVTRDLARAAGRSADAGIEGLVVNLASFSSEMTIGVDAPPTESARTARASQRASAEPPRALDLNSYLDLARRVLPEASPTPSVPGDAVKTDGEGQ